MCIIRPDCIVDVIILSILYNAFNDVMKWNHFPLYWPFVWGIHRSPVNSLHKGQLCWALMFSLICALNKRLSKQSWDRRFETPSRPSWRHCNGHTLSHNICAEFRCVFFCCGYSISLMVGLCNNFPLFVRVHSHAFRAVGMPQCQWCNSDGFL